LASRNDPTTAADYEFKPHERPLMPGSPATPEHPLRRRVGYFLIGVLISVAAGLANGLLIANLPQIQGDLGLTPEEGGWITAIYSMTNVCTSFVLIKFRQQFGLQRITRVFLVGFVLLTGLQCLVHSYATELAVRAAAGILAAGFSPLGFFYIMQAMPASQRMGGMIMGVGLGQIALPLARFVSPLLLANGNVQTLYLFEFGLALICFGSVALLRLPPSERTPVFEKLDGVSFALFAPGIALLVAVLVQGRIVWWSTPWIGYAIAAAIVLIGAAMLIEHNRANPMLNTRWIASRDILRFAAIAAVMRVLLGEQGYGSIGLLTLVGMGQDQLVHFYLMVTLASLAGLIIGLILMKPTDLLRPIVVAVLLIGIAAWMDSDASNLTRPGNLLLSQAMIAFATILFLGPTMMAGVLRALAKGPSHMVSFSAVFGVSQTIGGLGGTALLGSFQIIRQKYHSHELVQSITATDPLVTQRLQQLGGAYGRVVGDPVLRQAQGAATLSGQVSREAGILAFNDVFLLITWLAVLAFLWLGGRWLYLRIRGVNPLAADLAALQKMLANR